MLETLLVSVSFFFVALAAKKIGQWFSAIGLPYITGYLLAGMVAGPFVLGLLPEDSSTILRYVDELSLAVIAFVAGSELYLKEIRPRLRAIASVTGGVLVSSTILIGIALFFLTQFIPFTQGLPVSSRVAVALLGATILLALSPASTIAVIKEVRAKGSFTKTVLGVTVTMDVVIIVFFAVAVAIASALLNNMGFDAMFIALLGLDLGAALLLGYLTGKTLQLILATSWQRLVKIGLILAIGYMIFAFNSWLIGYSYANLPFEIHIEPLLVAMIGGFMVTNFSNSRHEFDQILHDVGPSVYVAFFALTGVTLKLDILLATLPIAIALFIVRAGGIALGSYLGGTFAGESNEFRRYSWMGLITQAGIALGLAREAAVEFPTLGDSFATMIISVVVLNEIFGPMLLKYALRRAGEAHVPAVAELDEERDVLILGIEPQSRELARQLLAQGWNVAMADTDSTHVDRLSASEIMEKHIHDLSADAINGLLNERTDAVVAMLANDEENLKALELAFTQGVKRLVVRPHDLTQIDAFRQLGALVIDPASAMVNLLDQSVRAPQTAAVLLHQDSSREVIQITVRNPDVDGELLRDLRLPLDVIFMDISRDGNVILPSGYTRVQLNDEITIVGRGESLQDAVLKLGF